MDHASAAELAERFDSKWTHICFLEETPNGPRCADPRYNGPDGLVLPGLLGLLVEHNEITRAEMEREREGN